MPNLLSCYWQKTQLL